MAKDSVCICFHRKTYTAFQWFIVFFKTKSEIKIFFEFLIAKLSSLCCILIEKLPLFIFKPNSESQGMPDLFMCDMSGAGELTSHAMPMHKNFKPVLDNWTIQQPGHRLQGSKSRTKLQLFIQLCTMPWQCVLQEEIFTESKHSLEWDLVSVSSLWRSTHKMLGLMLLERPELFPWWILCFSKVQEHLG